MTRGRHSSKNPEAPTASAPERWVPTPASGTPTGDGPEHYVEGE